MFANILISYSNGCAGCLFAPTSLLAQKYSLHRRPCLFSPPMNGRLFPMHPKKMLHASSFTNDQRLHMACQHSSLLYFCFPKVCTTLQGLALSVPLCAAQLLQEKCRLLTGKTPSGQCSQRNAHFIQTQSGAKDAPKQ